MEEQVVTSLADVITADMLNGVFDQIYALMPIVAVAVIGFLGFRKGWQFVKSQVKGA